jgi:hypothetical protein
MRTPARIRGNGGFCLAVFWHPTCFKVLIVRIKNILK